MPKETPFQKRQNKKIARAKTSASVAKIKAPKKNARAARIASVVSSKGPKTLTVKKKSTTNVTNNTRKVAPKPVAKKKSSKPTKLINIKKKKSSKPPKLIDSGIGTVGIKNKK